MIKSLSIRIAVVIMLIALAITAITSPTVYKLTYDAEIVVAKKTIWQLGKTVQRTATIATYLNNYEIGNDTIKDLSENEIVGSAVLSGDNNFTIKYGPALTNYSENFITTIPLESPFTEGELVGKLQIIPKQKLVEKKASVVANERVALISAYTFIVVLSLQMLFVRALNSVANQLKLVDPKKTNKLVIPVWHKNDEIGGMINNINKLLHLVKVKFDEEHSMRIEIETLEKQFRIIYEQASIGIFLIDTNNFIIMANPAFWNILNYESVQDWSNTDCLPRIFVEYNNVQLLLEETLADDVQTSGDFELKSAHSELECRWVNCLFNRVDKGDSGTYIQVIISDVSERKEMERSIIFQAEHDSLTGLQNRRAVEHTIESMLGELTGGSNSVAIFMIDLDDFKQINDTYGHAAGDKVLVDVSTRLQIFQRNRDVAARLGGDEFLLVIFGNISQKTLESVANRLIYQLTLPINIEKNISVNVGSSIGVVWTNKYSDQKDLMAKADQALYQVKNQGKNQYLINRDY